MHKSHESKFEKFENTSNMAEAQNPIIKTLFLFNSTFFLMLASTGEMI